MDSLNVGELFRSLLSNPSAPSSHQYLSPSTTPEPLPLPPAKNSVRFIENDPQKRREKYDGHRWRAICSWNANECTNISFFADHLCPKHHALKLNKPLRSHSRKKTSSRASLPIIKSCHGNVQTMNRINDEDDIEILEELCSAPTTRHPTNGHVKAEAPDFHAFSVDFIDEASPFNSIKREPTASTSHRPTNSTTNKDTTTEIEYLTSKTRTNGLNIEELMSKNLPPLTDFEEDYLATRLIQEFSPHSPMLDAQLFLHREATTVVKTNYRLKMDIIAPEYFYDFLLRHPRVPLRFSNWFSRCKPVPPTTGCPIDTKMWTLAMIVRGATADDLMDD